MNGNSALNVAWRIPVRHAVTGSQPCAQPGGFLARRAVSGGVDSLMFTGEVDSPAFSVGNKL